MLVFIGFECLSQAIIWGTTSRGGKDNQGVIFKRDAGSGQLMVKKEFLVEAPGEPGRNSFCEATITTGKLYGVTTGGGSNRFGILFEYEIERDRFTRLIDFNGSDNGRYPNCTLTQAADGKLYGTASSGGIHDAGTLFSFDPLTSGLEKLFDFEPMTGKTPVGDLIYTANGKLYGTTYEGGLHSLGTLYEFDLSEKLFTKVHDFEISTGGRPFGGLTRSSSGKIYGTTRIGGEGFSGVVFEFQPDGAGYIPLASFNQTNGAHPTSFEEGPDGVFYGTALYGGKYDLGVLFEFDSKINKVISRFHFNDTIGSYPMGRQVVFSGNAVLGVTTGGGTTEAGVIYEYNVQTQRTSKLTELDILSTGRTSVGGLMVTTEGRVFGLTIAGSRGGSGAIFEVVRAQASAIEKLPFNWSRDGNLPAGTMVQLSNGRFYGVTESGGQGGFGAFFEFDPETDQFSVVASFSGANGKFPKSSPVLGPNGKFYGVTAEGGSNDRGVIYEIDLTTREILNVHNFNASQSGIFPEAGLELTSNGLLIGTSFGGGLHSRGTIFMFDPATKGFEVIHSFDELNGAYPRSALTRSTHDTFLGLTETGGAANRGVIFEITLSTKMFKKLFDFPITTGNPRGRLVSKDGKIFFGTTTFGSLGPGGSLFEFDAQTGLFTSRYSFSGPNGRLPFSDVIIGTDGVVYGTTLEGGTNNKGVFFRYDLNASNVELIHFNGVNGANPFTSGVIQARKTQKILFDQISATSLASTPIPLSATATSELPVEFFNAGDDKIEISGNSVTLLSPGRAFVRAVQRGSDIFLPAPSVVQEFCINPVKPTVTVTDNNPLTPVLSSSADAGNLWYRDGIALPDQTGKTLTIATTGTYSVEVRVDGCVSERSDNFPVVITSLENESGRLLITPNPVTHRSSILLPGAGEYDVRIFSSDGRVVSRFRTGEQQVELNHANLSAGLYWVTATGDAHVWVAKFIKR